MRAAFLLLLPALVAQAQDPDLASSLQVATPEVERLIQALQPKIALERANGILPEAKQPWVGGDFAAIKKSTQQAEKDAIAAYNLAKKKTGNGPWVAAALLDKGNAAKYPTAREQSGFLHRLAVLDPSNATIGRKMDRLRKGTLAFTPAKAAKTPVPKKKK